MIGQPAPPAALQNYRREALFAREHALRGILFGRKLAGLIDKVASRGHLAGMRTVGLKALKNKLSEYVRAAALGETVVITDRGRPVAKIGPPRQEQEHWRERGIREGWLRPAVRGPNWPPKGKPIPGLTLEDILADLDEARKDPWC